MPEDAIILCGGAGLRLRPITGDGAKSMADVCGRPFLETLLRQLVRFGFHRVILAVGHAGGAIQSYFGERLCGIEIEYSNEPSLLGTGGALGNAAGFIKTNSCLVMNGDSYTDVDLHQVARAHRESEADISVVVVPLDERQDIGSVLLDAAQNVLQFAEKEPSHSARHLNAGIYMMTRAVINTISAASAVSLERELFPQWIREGRRVRAFVHSGTCVDIGTTERYQTAQKVLAHAELASAGARDEDHRS